MITQTGLCYASIKSEEEIGDIQKEIAHSLWIDQTIRWIEAIKDSTRFKLVYLLHRHEQLCVCDLANILNVSSSAISQHLRKLKDMDIVTVRRQKQTIFYRLKNQDFISFFDELVSQ